MHKINQLEKHTVGRCVAMLMVFLMLFTIMPAVALAESVSPPAIPTSIQASSESYNSIEVSWHAVDGADGYSIYRATKSSGPYTFLRLVSDTSFVDEALTTGQTHYYRVRGYIMDGSTRVYGAFAPAVAARPIPAAPANFRITDKTYTTLSMTWDAVAGATGYRVYRQDPGFSSFTQVADITATSYQDTRLKPGNTFTYKVAAYRTVGSTKIGGFQSNTASEQTPESTEIPTSVRASSWSYNSVHVSWDEVHGTDGYSIYRATKSSGPYTYLRLVSETSFVDEGLTTGQIYYYRVRSYIMDGSTRVYGAFAPAVAARPIPETPAHFGITDKTYTTVSMTWDGVSGATGYRIYRKISGSSTYTLAGDTTSTTYKNTGLKPGTTYTYKVAAYRTVGSTKIGGFQSNTASEQTLAAPGIPTSISARSASYNSIQVSWDAVHGADGYSIYRATKSSGPYTYLRLVSGTSFVDPGLTTGQIYYYRVRSYVMDGSARAYGTFAPAVAARPIPSAPTGLSYSNGSPNAIAVGWGTVTGATGYQLWYSTYEYGTYSRVTTTAAHTYTHTGLENDQTYYYKVRAYRMVGSQVVYGNFSSVLTAWTQDNSTEEPDFDVYISDFVEEYLCGYGPWIHNYGTEPMVFYDIDCWLCDYDNYEYDRELQLADEDWNQVDYIVIPPGQGDCVRFNFLGGYTRFNPNTTIYFTFTYDSITYMCGASHNFGTNYWVYD